MNRSIFWICKIFVLGSLGFGLPALDWSLAQLDCGLFSILTFIAFNSFYDQGVGRIDSHSGYPII